MFWVNTAGKDPTLHRPTDGGPYAEMSMRGVLLGDRGCIHIIGQARRVADLSQPLRKGFTVMAYGSAIGRLREDREKVVNLYEEGATLKKICDEYSVNRATLVDFLKENKVYKPHKPNYDWNKVLELHNSGMAAKAIDRELKMPFGQTLYMLKQHGLTANGPRNIREDKLVDHKEEIIAMYKNGKSCKTIAKQFEAVPASVRSLLLRVGEKLRASTRNTYTINHNLLEEINSSEKAWFLGEFASDGNQKNGKVRFDIKDKDILEKIGTLFNCTSPIKEKIRLNKNGIRQTFRMNLGSIKLCKRLTELGMPEAKTKLIDFPTEQQIPKSLWKDYIRGYFDGDGCLHFKIKENRIKLCITFVGNQSWCEKLAIYLKEELNIPCSVACCNVPKKKFTYYCRFQKIKYCKKFLDWLYKDATIYMDRKYKKYQEFIEWYENKHKIAA